MGRGGGYGAANRPIEPSMRLDMGFPGRPVKRGSRTASPLRHRGANAYIPATFQSSPMIWCFARKGGRSVMEISLMSTQPLMPKATAVWLVENTALSFDQI